MRRAALVVAVALAAACRSPEPETRDAAVAGPPPSAPVATSSVAIRYRVSVPQPSTHYLHVQASLPTLGRERLVVMMPVWTPGSYLVREYARHVDGFEATGPGGEALHSRKVRKNRYEIIAGDAAQVNLRYRVYANEPSVRTNAVDPEYLALSGAATFFTDVERLDAVHEVELALAPHYPDVACALTPDASGTIRAASYDELVDSPIVAGAQGALRRLLFEVRGVPHELIHVGAARFWPDARSARDVEALTREQIRFWRRVPYERYLFLNVVNEARGGLEHLGSTLMMTDRFKARTEKGYRDWLGLVSHELFHAWNGKRLRPEALGPFDYENEVYTRALWFVEGVTSYYDDLLLRRAGLMTEAQYLEALSSRIERLETRPGRAVQSLAESSYDAWIEFYRPDESSANTTISYYTKGAVVAFVLDAEIRRSSGGTRSLDDVMRAAYEAHAGERGFSDDALFTVFRRAGGHRAEVLARKLVYGTAPVPYDEALEYFGLRFEAPPEPPGPKATDVERRDFLRKKSWLGVQVERARGRLEIREVVAGGPAEQAGLQAGDEIVALDGIRLDGSLSKRLRLHVPGDEVAVLIARRGAMQTVRATVGERPRTKFRLEPRPGASAQAASRRADWQSQSYAR